MSDAAISHKPRASFYWRLWLAVVASAILSRAVVVFLFGGQPSSVISMAYAVVTWIPLLILGGNEGHRLLAYLKEHRRLTWERTTYVPFFGPGGNNTFRFIPWLDSPEGMDDPVLAAMKIEARKIIRLQITVFCTYPVLWLLLSI